MESVEKNEELVAVLRASIKAPEQAEILDQISADNFALLEACSFQDITGQRVHKVIKFVTHVEGRIDVLCDRSVPRSKSLGKRNTTAARTIATDSPGAWSSVSSHSEAISASLSKTATLITCSARRRGNMRHRPQVPSM